MTSTARTQVEAITGASLVVQGKPVARMPESRQACAADKGRTAGSGKCVQVCRVVLSLSNDRQGDLGLAGNRGRGRGGPVRNVSETGLVIEKEERDDWVWRCGMQESGMEE